MELWRSYLKLARPDHWIKHIFIIPGIIIAIVLTDNQTDHVFYNLAAGFISACLLASANYIINELLDAEYDQYHPTKSQRPMVSGGLKKELVILEYLAALMLGLMLSSTVSAVFFITAAFFVASGILYNVKPFRIKEKVYLDVILESFNNPIRLMFGWSMISDHTLAPLSLLIAYWLGGAFLMAAKRYSEYRTILASCGVNTLYLYRKSFEKYTETSLLLSSFYYAILSALFFGVFMIKYRTELILSIPGLALLFIYYLWLGIKGSSSVEAPEKLYKEKKLFLFIILLVTLIVLLFFIDLPWIDTLIQSRFTEVSFGR